MRNYKSLFSSPLAPTYIISMLLGIAIGVSNPVISLYLMDHNVDSVTIGLNASLFFLCVAITSAFAHKVAAVCNLFQLMSLGLILLSLTSVLWVFSNDLSTWFLLRAVMGTGLACCMICGQYIINYYGAENHRALISGIYGLAFGIGLAIGPVIGTMLYQVEMSYAFYGTACLYMLGIALTFYLYPRNKGNMTRPAWHLVPLLVAPLFAVFSYGFAESTLLSVYPIVLSDQFPGNYDTGKILSAFVIGGMLSTLPVAFIGDQYGHLRTLFVICLLGVIGLISLYYYQSYFATLGSAFLVGISIGPIFPLTLAIMGQRVSKNNVMAASAMFTLAFGAGSSMGPWLSATSITYIGNQFVFLFTSVLFIVLLFGILKRGEKCEQASI